MSKCLFCEIAAGKIPSDRIYENESVVAFRDINPQAPEHVLVISKKHIPTTNDLEETDKELIGEIILSARDIAKELKISETGYRMVFNCNEDAGQAVWHIHLHLLGGRKMTWPPG